MEEEFFRIDISKILQTHKQHFQINLCSTTMTTSDITFYASAISPFSRALEVCLNLLDVKFEKKYVDMLKGEHKSEDYAKINPRLRVPALTDGPLALSESRAIMCYLVNKYGKEDNTLYPRDLEKRAKVDEMLYIDATDLVPSQYAYIHPLFHGGKFNDAATARYTSILEFLNKTLGSGKFLLGDAYTLADLSVASSLFTAVAVDYDLSKYPNILSYLDKVSSSIPSFKAVTDTGVERLKGIIEMHKAKK